MKSKRELINEQQKKEIFYNIINSFLSGALVFFGTIVGAGFEFSFKGVCIAFGVAFIVFLTKFKGYWDGEAGEYSKKLFNFVNY